MTPEFFQIHSGLDREGPGDRASLRRALDPAAPKRDGVILDAGCGPGGDIEGLLGFVPDGRVVAIDAHGPFVGQAAERFMDDGRVDCMLGDMRDPGGPYDVIWCAGALYFLGLEEGIAAMAGHLKPGGVLAFSYPCFFAEAPSEAARAFWGGDIPIPGEDRVREAVAEAGLAEIAAFRLPDAAWEAYYGPLAARLDALAAGASPALAEAIAAERAEIAAWRGVRGETGYLQITGRAP